MGAEIGGLRLEDFYAYQAAFPHGAAAVRVCGGPRLSARRAGRRTDRDALTGARACEGPVSERVAACVGPERSVGPGGTTYE